MKPQFKNIVLAVLPLTGVLLISPIVSAHHHDRRDEERNSIGRVSEEDLHSFDDYLDSHWETAQDLYREPNLLNNRTYVRKHKALKEWLADHDEAARTIRANPRAFLWRDRAYQRHEERRPAAQVSEQDLRSFDTYLDSHSETAQLLYQDPDLVNDRRFLHDHAALHDWLDDHSDAAEAIRANPRQFMWRERASQRRNPQSLDPEDLSSFERYLDAHSEVADALYKDPNLINDPRFVRSQGSLDDWLRNHPDAAQAISDRPRDFLWRERSLNAQDFLRQLLR